VSHRGISRHASQSFEEIAAELGITRDEVFSAYRSGIRKIKMRKEISILRALSAALDELRMQRRRGKTA